MGDDALQQDLESLSKACDAAKGAGSPLCLYRVATGLDAASWSLLRQRLGLEGWNAAPLSALDPHFLFQKAAAQDLLLRQFLLCEMDRARHCQQPLALALIEPGAPDAMEAVLELAQSLLRSFDHASVLQHGPLAVVLSGTPLAAAERQLGSLLRRIRQISHPSLVCSAGLVGYGGLVEMSPQTLLERAALSLAEARRLGGNRLEVAPSADAEMASRETLVRANEKHFLFTGKKLPE